MERASVNGIELEYDRQGRGDPILLVHGAFIPDAMRPLGGQDALESFELICYHRRGFAGSSRHDRANHPRRRRPGREERRHHSLEIELPAVVGWSFGTERAGTVACPLLSVLGTATAPLVVESRQLLHEWFAHCVDADIPGATHLLQLEAPAAVAAALAQLLGQAA